MTEHIPLAVLRAQMSKKTEDVRLKDWRMQTLEWKKEEVKSAALRDRRTALLQLIQEKKHFWVKQVGPLAQERRKLQSRCADVKALEVLVVEYGIKLVDALAEKENSPDSELRAITNSVLLSFKEQVNELPGSSFWYEVTPEDYLYAYDIPQLAYLAALKQESTGNRKITPSACSERYHPILQANRDKKSQGNKDRCFGIEREGIGIKVPLFCEMGRLEAYKRFISERGRIKDVHSFRYQVHSFGKDAHIDRDAFCNEDAWYYEMCTGASLTAELASLVVRILEENKDPDDRERKEEISDPSSTWGGYFEQCVYSALQKNREWIITCPAVYWRIISLRRAVRKFSRCCLDLYGREEELSSISKPETERSKEWVKRACQAFRQLLITENNTARWEMHRLEEPTDKVCDTAEGVCGKKGRGEGACDVENGSDGDMLEGRDPVSVFRTTTCSRYGWSHHTPSEKVALAQMGALLLQEPEGTDSCLKFCMSLEEEGIRQFIAIANQEANSKAEYKGKRRKLRKGNRYERVFREIHRALYGKWDTDKAKDDGGFLYLAGI